MAALKRPRRVARRWPARRGPTPSTRTLQSSYNRGKKTARICTAGGESSTHGHEKAAPETNLTPQLVASARNYADILIRMQDPEFGKLHGEERRGYLWIGDDGPDNGKWVEGVKDAPARLPRRHERTALACTNCRYGHVG